MIYYVVTDHHDFTIRTFLEGRGAELRDLVQPLFYAELERVAEYPPGAYLFADIERIAPADAEGLALLRDRLAAKGDGYRVLNHPTRSLRRHDLMRALQERGINPFDVYRADERRATHRFPVFLRGENDHLGTRSDLLHTPGELAEAPRQPDDLVVEFQETRGADGIYRKYSVFRVGNRLIRRHLFFSRDWMIKEADLDDPSLLDEEWRFVTSRDHEAQVREVFELAKIEFGRIDYSLDGDRIVVWEINTNPMVASEIGERISARSRVHELAARGVVDALRNLAPEPGPRIAPPVATRRRRWWRIRKP